MSAGKKIIAVLGAARGIGEVINGAYDNGPPKTVKRLTDRLQGSTRNAFKAYTYVNIRNKKEVGKVCNVYHDIGVTEIKTIPTACSFCIATLSDIQAVLKNKKRIELFEKVIKDLQAINNYYDRNQNKHEEYQLGFELSQSLEGVMGG